ncbi:uncharacterized protein RJT21DRAFT_113545 [Scheffersomyces amazonensis]|uniref:uncharacterized protein n=1 Tax=Scheffersomyces amazonensis TaxID=1078765 RepID=UPI00315D6BFC
MTLVETDGPTFELLGGYITINDLFLEADESNGVYLGDTPFGGWSKVGDPILSLEGFGTEFYICPEQSIPLQLNMIDCNCFIGELHVLEEEPTSVTDGATIAYVSSVCNSGSSSTTAATTATTNDATITTTYTSNEIITITDCPETVTHCPLNSIRTTTVVHTITTIYCPESDGTTTSTSENTHTATGSTITTTFTSNEVIKITDCPETITDCPLNSIRTVTIIHTLTATYWPEVVNNSPEAASPLEIYTTPIVNTKNGGAISTGTGLVAVITNEVGATTATLITSGVQSLYTTTVTNTSCTESYPCTKTAVVVVGSNASGEFTSIVAEGKIESNTAAQINAESIFTNSARTNAIQPNVSNNADITTATTISDVHSTFDTIPYSSTLVSLGPSVSIVDDESGAVANEWKILTSYIVSLIILAFV